GKCIYCGAKRYSPERERLGDEHIVAFSLGGKVVLPQASCNKCEKMTSGIEYQYLRFLLSNAVLVLNLPNRSKQRPTAIDLDQEDSLIKIMAEDFPLVMFSPLFPRAGILAGTKPTGALEAGTYVKGSLDEELWKILSRQIPNFQTQVVLQHYILGQVLAKV